MNARPSPPQRWQLAAYGRPEDLRRVEFAPAPLAPTQVLVQVAAAALNPLDLKLMDGRLKDVMPTAFPFAPGTDVCGVVVDRGRGVDDFQPGDRVVAFAASHGAMATHVVCDTQGVMAPAPVGDAVDLASLPEAGMTALAILREAAVSRGQVMAIIGATGGIGLILCQLARRLGVTVLATARPSQADVVRANGVTEIIDHTAGDTVAAIRALHPAGVDVLVDLVNQFEALVPGAFVVRPGGRLVSTLFGPPSHAFPVGVDVRYIRLNPDAKDLRELLALAAAGSLRSTVSRRFAFADVPAAYIALRDGHGWGKLVVQAG